MRYHYYVNQTAKKQFLSLKVVGNLIFQLRISLVSVSKPQFSVDSFKFTKKILKRKLHFLYSAIMKLLTQLIPRNSVSRNTFWRQTFKTFGFLMFSGGSKGNIGKKRVKTKTNSYFAAKFAARSNCSFLFIFCLLYLMNHLV